MKIKYFNTNQELNIKDDYLILKKSFDPRVGGKHFAKIKKEVIIEIILQPTFGSNNPFNLECIEVIIDYPKGNTKLSWAIVFDPKEEKKANKLYKKLTKWLEEESCILTFIRED